MRAESAVEPTRSENITVTWRRSAVSECFNSAVTGSCCSAPKLLDSREHYPPMPEQDVEILEVLISQMGKRRKIDAVVGKSLSVLLKPEVFEPTSNLLHRRPPTD